MQKRKKSKSKRITNADKLSREYQKAYKRYNEMSKQGFIFDKRTQKLFSAESFQKKAMKPTKRSIDLYKGLNKKALYKKAKGFYDVEKNEVVSVSKGKKKLAIARAKNAKLKATPVASLYTELYQMVASIENPYMDISDERREVMHNYDRFVEEGGQVTPELKSRIAEYIEVITYSSKQEIVNDAFDGINSLLTSGSYTSEGGYIDVIGTPFENLKE